MISGVFKYDRLNIDVKQLNPSMKLEISTYNIRNFDTENLFEINADENRAVGTFTTGWIHSTINTDQGVNIDTFVDENSDLPSPYSLYKYQPTDQH